MTSNLGCVGLGVDDVAGLGDLLAELIPAGTASRQADGSALYIWRDDSGARLTITTDRAGAIDDVTPSYVGEPGAVLAGLTPLHDSIVAADVLLDDEITTRLACEVLAPGPVPESGPAVVTAFGLDVSLHPSESAFLASPASLLVGDAEDAEDTEPQGDEDTEPQGDEEPLRMAAESFLAFGLFGDPAEAEPVARLNGTVLAVSSATVGATGQAFHAVRVRTVGMEVDVCLAATDHPIAPEPGAVVAGTVYLVADVERPPPRRRRFGLR
jgi:hypothetical protein